eukprot:scaffold19250_cov58-Phaeocystis_antarctica.AAC.7
MAGTAAGGGFGGCMARFAVAGGRGEAVGSSVCASALATARAACLAVLKVPRCTSLPARYPEVLALCVSVSPSTLACATASSAVSGTALALGLATSAAEAEAGATEEVANPAVAGAAGAKGMRFLALRPLTLRAPLGSSPPTGSSRTS